MDIRRAASDDLHRVAEVALACFPEDFSPGGAKPSLQLARQWVKGRDALYPFSLTFVAAEGAAILGYVQYMLLGGVSGVVELEAIGVAPAQRQRGIGGQLMSQTEAQVIQHLQQEFGISLAKIILTTAAANPDSHHLYQSQGYVVTGHIGPLFWGQEEVVYMKDFEEPGGTTPPGN